MTPLLIPSKRLESVPVKSALDICIFILLFKMGICSSKSCTSPAISNNSGRAILFGFCEIVCRSGKKA